MPSPNVARIQSRKFPVVPAAPVAAALAAPIRQENLNFFRQVAQIALERIGNPGIVALHNPALADALVDFFAHDLVDEVVEVFVVREDDVAALVPHEPVFIDMRSGVTSDVAGFLVQYPIVVAQLVKAVGRTQSGRSASDDDNSLAHSYR